MDKMYQRLKEIIFSLHNDMSIVDYLAPKIKDHFQGNKDITQSSLFKQFYEDYLTMNIQYDEIVALFEEMLKDQQIKKGRLKYLLTHWLYYQVFKVKEGLAEDAVMQNIKQKIDGREQPDYTISKISQDFGFDHNQSAQFKRNIENSSIFPIFKQYLSGFDLNKIEQKYQELIHIIERMSASGQSIQYQLQKHIHATFQKAYNKSSWSEGKFAPLIPIKSLQKEIHEKKRMNQKMKRYFDQVYQVTNEKRKFGLLEGIKAELVGLDVFLLDYLIAKSKKNESQEEEEGKKDIILFVGPTGVGKTTIILKILGYKLVETQIHLLKTLQPLNLRSEHAALLTSPGTTSTTRYMFAAKIPQQSFSVAPSGGLYVCDSPGFDDTAGCEVDISNSISIQRFLKRCDSVKLVVVISQRMIGTKFQGIRQVANIVSNIVKKYSQIQQHVSIVLNKFESQQEYKRLRPGIQLMLKQLNPAEIENVEFVSFLKSLVRKLKNNRTTRFNPKTTDIPDFLDQLQDGKIMNPNEIFRYSLSNKSTQQIRNRKTTLSKLISDSIKKGKNHQALYYLQQLCLLGQFLDQQLQIQEQIIKMKELIRNQVDQNFKHFQKLIEGSILSNDSNNRTFQELKKIKQNVQSFEIFSKSIQRLVTSETLLKKEIEAKNQMLKEIQQLQFSEQKFDDTKNKVLKKIKFFKNFEPKLQKQVINILVGFYKRRKGELKKVLESKQSDKIRHLTNQLNNIIEILQKGRQNMIIDRNNPELAIIEKKQKIQLIQLVSKHFQKLVAQSTNFIQTFKRNPTFFQLDSENINLINKNIDILEQLETDGPILNQIYSKNYKNQIINEICAFGIQQIEQLTILLNQKDSKTIQHFKHHKQMTQQLKLIKGVIGGIGDRINPLWANFQRLIITETDKLKELLSSLKNKKQINIYSLKSFKKKIDTLIKFSQGDASLAQSNKQLKIQIMKQLKEHILSLRTKIDNIKVTLNLKLTLQQEKVKNLIDKFKQIEAFFQIKQFIDPKYFPEDKEEKNTVISVIIQQLYMKALAKFLNPFAQMANQFNKVKDKSINIFPPNCLQNLNLFLNYKDCLQVCDIRRIQQQIQKFLQANTILSQAIPQIIIQLKKYFDSLSEAVENSQPDRQIYRFEQSKMKQFKNYSLFFSVIFKYPRLEQEFQLQGLEIKIYQSRLVEMLQKSSKFIRDIQLANRRLTDISYQNNLRYLKKQVEELKIFDQLCFEQNQIYKFDFNSVQNEINDLLKLISSQQVNTINNLFKDDHIQLPQIKIRYQFLLKNGSNDDSLHQICNGLQLYGQRQLDSMNIIKQQYKNDASKSLETQNAIKYINKLQKIFKLYQDLKQFMKPQFLDTFQINKKYFQSEIAQLEIEQRIKKTYQTVRDKIISFDYKRRARQFEGILIIMKKAQTIVEKITNDSDYSIIYQATAKQEVKNEKYQKVQELQAAKFSERLQYFMKKTNNKLRGVVSQIDENQQEILKVPNLITIYNNSSQQEKMTIEQKIEMAIAKELQCLDKTYSKTGEQQKKSTEEIKRILARLPPNLKKQHKNKLQQKLQNLKDRQQNQMNKIRNLVSKTVFDLIPKFQECKNLNVQREMKKKIEEQLQHLMEKLVCHAQNKRLIVKQSFEKYLKYFGSPNSQIIRKIMNNKKIRQIFEYQEKMFLNNLASEQKQLIREIQGLFNRVSVDRVDIYRNKCIELNKVYILALQDLDDYQGPCRAERKSILENWEQYIAKVMANVQQLNQALSIDLNNYSAINLQKDILKIKLIRIFIDNQLVQTNNNKNINRQNFKFIFEANNYFKTVTIDKQIIQKFIKQIKQKIANIDNFSFYNEQMKILNYVNLEKQLQQKLINSLKILEEYQMVYNQYLCQREQDEISKKELMLSIQKKWEENIQMTKQQVEDAIAFPQVELSQRITILYNLTQIVTKKRWTFVDKQKKSREDLQQFLQMKFLLLNQFFDEDVKGVHSIIEEKKKIQNKYLQNKSQIKASSEKIEKNIQAEKKNIQRKIMQAVDQKVKEKLNLQFQNSEKLQRQKIQQANHEIYDKYTKQKEGNKQLLSKFIKDNIIKHLIAMKKVIHSVSLKSRDNQSKLSKFLQVISVESKEIKETIFKQLMNSKNNHALMIAAEENIFKFQTAKQFHQKTSKQDIDYIIKNCPQIQEDKQLKQRVKDFYKAYEIEYKRIIAEFLKNPDKQQINITARKLKDIKDKNENRKYRDEIKPAHIIAKIFATWSMMKVDFSDKQAISVDFQPHPAQIVAIFLLIGLDDSKFKNTMIQVLTGEGKSIILAGVCIYLALKGYRPCCACYSQYLSSRDERQFKQLFDLLDVSSKIKYGTFNQHCEEIINQAAFTVRGKSQVNKNFRQSIKNILINQPKRQFLELLSKIFDKKSHESSKKILIIDQADVFFNETFYGKLYCPSVSLEDQSTKNLIEYIWTVTKESRLDENIKKIRKEQILRSEQFKKVAREYPFISQLIENQVVGMLQAAYNYHHQYIIHQDSIKYRDNDSITSKISYGYKTVFANCYEFQRKAISQISYSSSLKITLNIAPFSYSQLPTFFQSILGVSGTISQISDYKRQMLEEKYGIKETYQIPSIYGENQRTKDNFAIVKNQQFYDRIAEHAEKISEEGRPIALFFKTIKDVTTFYKSPHFKQFKKNTTILTEQTDHELRQTIIKRVGQRGKITILTESFARGTDFKIFDKTLNQIGGLHVIQTYIASNLSEYVQTRGRTARQGNKGSYQILINQMQLEKFQIKCEPDQELQQKMKAAWQKRDQSQLIQLTEKVDKARLKHVKTQEIFKKKPSHKELIEFIYSHNKYSEINKNHVKTLIGIDGTASMGGALKKTFDILEDSFVRTKTILQKKKISGSFENQIGIYRNYDSTFDKILEYSGFEADSQKLRQFLQKIKNDGGWGNEAMEVLFQHANKINKLDQIIIIADAKSNNAKETKNKREKQLTQQYWVDNGFPLTNEEQQVLKLKNKNVKIHTLYINLKESSQQKKRQLKKYCNDISYKTGGISQEFKINDINASEMLTGFLVKNILMLIGGEENGRELINSYNQEYLALRLS